MRKHEDFEELTALAAIGQLSVEEHAELLDTCEAALSAGALAISLTSSLMNSRYPSPPLATETSSNCRPRAIGRDSWREPAPKAYVLHPKRWVRREGELQLLSSETGVRIPWV